MASENVVWLLPWMVLQYGFIYALILGWGSLYGFGKFRSGSSLFRDIIILSIVLGSATYGLTSDHSVIGLLLLGTASGMSLVFHSNEFSKTNDMAPFGYLTAISIITTILVVSGILTSEM